MGVFLDKPKKEKELESGEGNGMRYALCSMQGWRVEMEDAHSIQIDLSPNFKNCSYFAVFDGHAGDFVSNYSSKHLIGTVMELWLAASKGSEGQKSTENSCCLTDSVEVEEFRSKLIEGFLKIDSKMRELPKFLSGEERSGTTAVASFVTPNKIIFANCGDSRALLCSKQTVKFATSDHKPYNEEEKRRIENAGGSVMIQRVNGSLAVSRALGDYDYKNVSGLPPTQQLVSAEPDVSIIERSAEDEFLILACDGIWDVMTNEEIVEYISSRLTVQENLQKVCEELLETCLAKGSRDNMSVILITFNAAPKISPEAVEKEQNLEKLIKAKLEEIVKEKGSNIILTECLDELADLNLPDLPPGGGLHSKMCYIEEILDELLPNRSKDENRGMLNNFPVPLSVIRQFASDNPEMETDEQEDDGPY